MAAIILNTVLVLVQGWSCFSPSFKAVDFVSMYVEIPIMVVMFVVWKLFRRTRWVRLHEMDLVTDRYDSGQEQEQEQEQLDSLGSGFELDTNGIGIGDGVAVDAAGSTKPGLRASFKSKSKSKSKLFVSDPDEKGVIGKLKRFGMWLFL